MNQDQQNFTHQLQQLMQQGGVSTFKQLSRTAGVSERQVMRLRRGEVAQMRVETLVKLSQVLKVSASELLETFGQIEAESGVVALRKEYQRLQTQLEQQRETLKQEFQQSSLQALESFLLFWPTAAYKAQENPQLPAVNLLRLVSPVEKLVQQWGVEAIASVGEEIAYDPQLHQLIEGTAQPGQTVRVRNIGYRHGEKLLHRVKVSAIGNIHKA
ncbi:helix-turn-helix domain-containing protein [Microcoleus sp. FACHB-831]|uniref:helix-turn-helix domain-containing protein n=1 Tax=Microcoleus sp. FACHB-831 TaxID=2692827 RepID=UPI0016828BA8|nr:helix-turn-helix domain-containing protein [Microcoleus sp. FACHB-831]MBD1924114.1 helix-turn-helix domain-containing protein [Microcoleus sp. FACHB-831]